MRDGSQTQIVGDWPAAVETVNEAGSSDMVLMCEHASRHVPAVFAGLGLGGGDLARHIAWDIGAAALARKLARRLDAVAFLGTYSRLLIDLNRPLHSATSIPECSEDTVIPGNAGLDGIQKRQRADRIFRPYHARVTSHIDDRERRGRRTRLVAIHSFTPVFLGKARPWHVGILFDAARVQAETLARELGRDPGLVIGLNQPYAIHPDEDYGLLVHGDARGNDAVLIEVRQDLLTGDAQIEDWAKRLAGALTATFG